MTTENATHTKRSLLRRITLYLTFFTLAIIVLLMLLFGFMQTSTFREILREKVTSIINSELNGKVVIGNIDGTFFTSLSLNNVSLFYENEEIVKIDYLETRFLAIDLLANNITIRRLLIQNSDIKLQSDSLGVLNISKVFPASKKKDSDTIKSPFPYRIYVDRLIFKNINFSLRDFKHQKSSATYSYMNFDDLNIKEFNLDVAGYADLNKKRFSVRVKDLNFKPNFNYLSAISITGNFEIDSTNTNIDKLQFKSPESQFLLSSDLKNFRLFSHINPSEIQFSLFLEAPKISFRDVSVIVPTIEFLKGDISKATLSAEGSLKDLNVKILDLDYDQTKLRSIASLKNLDDPKNLYIDCKITNSSLDPLGPLKLLPSLNLPNYSVFGQLKIDSLTYQGKIDNFRTGIKFYTAKGEITGNCSMDLRTNVPGYSVDAVTKNLDISPFVNQPIILSSNIELKGKGFDPNTLQLNAKLDCKNSSYKNILFDSLTINTEVKEKHAELQSFATIDSQNVNFATTINFEDLKSIKYDVSLDGQKINLQEFTSDTSLSSSLNISLNSKGENFDPEKISAKTKLNVFHSSFKNKPIGDLTILLIVNSSENGKKEIIISSTLADIRLTGNFNYVSLAKVLGIEADTIAERVLSKVEKFYPLQAESNIALSMEKLAGIKPPVQTIDDSSFNIPAKLSFEAVIRDLSPISYFIGERKIKADCNFTGSLEYSINKDFMFFLSTDIKELLLKDKTSQLTATKVKANLNFRHPFYKYDFDKFKMNIGLHSKSILVEGESAPLNIKDCYFDGNLLNSKFDISKISVEVNDNIFASISTKADLSADSLIFQIVKTNLKYNDFEIKNKNTVECSFNNNKLLIKNFELYRNNSIISINASLTKNKIDTAIVLLKNFSGYDLGNAIMGINPKDMVDGILNMALQIGGTLQKPIIKGVLTADNLVFRGTKLGRIKSTIDYADKRVLPFIEYLGNSSLAIDSLLQLDGCIPIDLSFTDFKSDILTTDSLYLNLKAHNFTLSPYSNLIPSISKIKGMITGDLAIHGYYPNLVREGVLRLKDSKLVFGTNNLEYNAGLKIRLADSTVFIDSILVSNAGGVQKKGIVTGNGKIDYRGFDIKSLQIMLNGDLTVLSSTKRTRDLDLFGELYIATDGNIVFSKTGVNTDLRASIIVKQGNITFPPIRNNNVNTGDHFVYKYAQSNVKDSVIVDPEQKRWQEISAKYKEKKETITKALPQYFGYKVVVKIIDEARMTFIFSEETNQKLSARLQGEITYSLENGQQDIQGEMKLLDGSTLELMNLKSFKATGSLKFESDVTNPYLNIVGVYRSYYTFKATSINQNPIEKEVAVKVKLKGALTDLSGNFMRSDDNIAIYVGTDNIDKDMSDPQYDKADAVYFILVGKFKNDLTTQDKSTAADQINAFEGTATSVAGSLLGGLLSNYLGGDYIQSLDLRSALTGTKFNVSGKIADIQYSFGGATNVFTDIANASFKLDYPLIKNLLLRVERKEAVTTTGVIGDMINELGLKYKFEF